MSIKENIQHLVSEIKPYGASLIAVSKTKPVEDIMEAYEAGQRDFGENKVQEMSEKFDRLPKDIRWHMIGHLQTNKVKYIAAYVHLIHGVDRVKLLKEINKQGEKADRIVPCLLQIHIAREETKFGFSYEEAEELFSNDLTGQYPYVKIEGLMGMATFTDDEQVIASEFNELAAFYKKTIANHQLNFNYLSMGMSGDYPIALKAGSNLVRVGSAIFGERIYQK